MLPINSTYILTPELKQGGWKLMSELVPGDPFYIFDKETKKLKIEYFDGFKYKAFVTIDKLKYLFNDIFSYGRTDNYRLEQYYPFSNINGYNPVHYQIPVEFDDTEYLKILLYLLGGFGFAKKSEYGYYMYEIYLDKIKNNPLVPDNIAFIRSIQSLGRTLDIPAKQIEDEYTGNTLIINLSIIDDLDAHNIDYTKYLYKWIDVSKPYIDSTYANHFLKAVRSIMASITGFYDIFTINYKDAGIFQNLGILSGLVPVNKTDISDVIENDELDKHYPQFVFQLDFLNHYKENNTDNQIPLFNPKDRFDIWEYLDRAPSEEETIEVANLPYEHSGIIIKQSMMDILGVPDETPPYIVGM